MANTDYSLVVVDNLELIVASDPLHFTPCCRNSGDGIECLISKLSPGAIYFSLPTLHHREQGGILTWNSSRRDEVGQDNLATK